MKITDIKTYILNSQLEKPFAYSQGWVSRRSTTIVEIITDEGIIGWGETFSVGLQPPEITATIIESAMKPLLLGEDPTSTEVLWHKMYHHTRDYGRKGVIIAAISAIDIALWDIVGKVLHQPIYKLLGGKFRDQVQAYASGFSREHGRGESIRLAREAEGYIENGFELMKVKIGFGLKDDLQVIEEVYNATGENITLMVDANHAYSSVDAAKLGQSLERFNLRWFEEPVAPEDLSGYQYVKNKINIPIASGEGEYTLFGFKNLLDSRAIDIAQPDVCLSGGFTACKHIMALTHAYGVQMNPHVWGTAIGQYASLQLLAAIPAAHHSLFPNNEPIFEYDTSSHPFRTELVENPIEQTNGWVEIPHDVGLGMKVNSKFLNKQACLV